MVVGFLGVLLIIRPGFGGFNPSVFWVLVAVVGVAVRDLVTQIIPVHVGSSIISFQAFCALAGVICMVVSLQTIAPINSGEVALFYLYDCIQYDRLIHFLT